MRPFSFGFPRLPLATLRASGVGVALLLASRLAGAEDAPAPAAPRGAPAPAAPKAPGDGPIVLRTALRISAVGSSARSLVHTDAVEALVVSGEWKPPRPGREIELPDGTMRRWTEVKADEKGEWSGDVVEKGAYLSFRVASDVEKVMLLHAVGNDFAYVNGELRPGDPYSYGWLRLPVLLRKGDNELLVRASRGHLVMTLEAPPAPVFLSVDDATMPDVLRPAKGDAWSGQGAVVVVNATDRPFVGNVYTSWPDDLGATAVSNSAVRVPAMSLSKSPVLLPPAIPGPDESARCRFELVPDGHDFKKPVSTAEIRLRVRRADEIHKRTYVSKVDGSVQYYAVNPPLHAPAEALLLSLHGAGVEALGQAEVYGQKLFDAIVCPTNRRPYGFDWEDWGRWDAQDVLGFTWEDLRDKSRVYLTGHSMGGHGTWQLGVLLSDRFAAIGPSAGWASFQSYGGAPSDPTKDEVEGMLRRAASPSDTTAYLGNLTRTGVYVLHGDADDQVPVGEARALRKRLEELHHPDLRWHEQPGAGHWWDASKAPGADCVDWTPMMEFFARRRLPAYHDVSDVDFSTPDPSVARGSYWLEIRSQLRSRVPSRVRMSQSLSDQKFVGTTENVASLAIAVEHLDATRPITVEIDGTILPWTAFSADDTGSINFERDGGVWRAQTRVIRQHKYWRRAGPFKAAFDRRFMLVVGTQGTPDENAWAAARARLDAETWYYRGNGTTEIVADTEYVASKSPPTRNVILYGHADMNAAWKTLLGASPVQVRRGALRFNLSDRTQAGLACLFVVPIEHTDELSVAVVAGTDVQGLRLTDRLPYFSSGVGFPDLLVLSTDMLTKGAPGVLGAGFFGNDWSVEKGEFAWR